ncbi:MAG TPA: ABC transporter ATP-binding protein [Ktedonobacterales bacterium]|nr:ABC transporter ATP-binding protein [Ktedonobacterales bacterium]
MSSTQEEEREEIQEVTPAQPTEKAVEKPTEKALIIAEGLSKHFTQGGELIKAVDRVSFKISPRQLVAITGPSGCGKTTLLYLLGSLEKPTSGKLLIDGIDVFALKGRQENDFRSKKVGFVFQSYNLIPNLSAVENVALAMEVSGKYKGKDRTDRAHDLLDQVGLEERRHEHRPGKLSGGQQQRVAIARALANDPAVILADEPTGNLDSKTGRRIVELLLQLAHQGRTVIVVTHDRSIARLADRRMELEDGRIISIKSNSNMAQSTTQTKSPTTRK